MVKLLVSGRCWVVLGVVVGIRRRPGSSADGHGGACVRRRPPGRRARRPTRPTARTARARLRGRRPGPGTCGTATSRTRRRPGSRRTTSRRRSLDTGCQRQLSRPARSGRGVRSDASGVTSLSSSRHGGGGFPCFRLAGGSPVGGRPVLFGVGLHLWSCFFLLGVVRKTCV